MFLLFLLAAGGVTLERNKKKNKESTEIYTGAAMNISQKKLSLEFQMRQNETLYHSVNGIFGGIPHVFRYYDQLDEISSDLLTVEDVPIKGVLSYSTLGLIHYPIGQRLDEKPLRIEIAGACYQEFEYYPNLLSSCAFEIMNAHFTCHRGAVYPDCVNMYVQGSPMKHLLFYPFSFWGKELETISFEDKVVKWFTAIPISESELAFLEKNPPEELVGRLKDTSADLFNLRRAPLF